jgi:hypothetical protein
MAATPRQLDENKDGVQQPDFKAYKPILFRRTANRREMFAGLRATLFKLGGIAVLKLPLR